MIIKDFTHNRQNAQTWYYWVYTDGDEKLEFIQWCSDHLTVDTIVVPRYNSGNPMVEVTITNEEDQALFKLRWLNENKTFDA